MSNWIDIIRRIIISPEFAVILLVILIAYLNPNWLSEISNTFDPSLDGVKFLFFVPVGVTLWCLRQSKTILYPAEDTKGLLQEWPNYTKLKIRFIIGISYQALFCISDIVIWITIPNLNNNLSVIIMSIAIIGSLVGAITFYFASLKATEISKLYATGNYPRPR